MADKLPLGVAGSAQRSDNSRLGGNGVRDGDCKYERDERYHHVAHYHRARFVAADILYREGYRLIQVARDIVIHGNDASLVDLVFEFLVGGHFEIPAVKLSVGGVLYYAEKEIVKLHGQFLAAGLLDSIKVCVPEFLLGGAGVLAAGEHSVHRTLDERERVVVHVD